MFVLILFVDHVNTADEGNKELPKYPEKIEVIWPITWFLLS